MTTSPVPIPPPPPMSPRVVPARPSLPAGLHAWSRAVETALALNMVWAAASIGYLFAQSTFLDRFLGSTFVTSRADLVDHQHRTALVLGTGLLLLVVTGVLWLVWWTKAHGAASAGRAVRHSRAWAIGGWFVPFANLVVPKRVADDLWTAAREPGRPHDAGVVSSGLVTGWWIAWLASMFSSFSVSGNGTTVSDVRAAGGVQVVHQLLLIVAAALAFRLVRTVTAGFEEQVGVSAPARGRGFRFLVVAGTVLVLVGTVIAGENAFEQTPHRGANAQAVDAGSDGAFETQFESPGSPFSLQVPDGWSVTDRSKLADPVVFDAGNYDEQVGATVIEMPNTGPMSWDDFGSLLEEQYDVAGDVTQTTVELPGGHATCFAMTSIEDGTQYDHRFYLFEGDVSVFMVSVTATHASYPSQAAMLDGVVASFRMDAVDQAGQGV